MGHKEFAEMIEPRILKINDKTKERTASDFFNYFYYNNSITNKFVERCFINGELRLYEIMAYFTNQQILKYLEYIESIWL